MRKMLNISLFHLNTGTFLKQMNDLNEFAISSDRSNYRQSRVLVTNVSILRSLLFSFFNSLRSSVSLYVLIKWSFLTKQHRYRETGYCLSNCK